MRNALLLAVFSFVLAATMGCTRKADKADSLTITFSPHGSGAPGAQTITGNLEFAVINIHLSTGLIVKQLEYHDNPVPAGQKVSIEIPSVPKGQFLVQFLGVFENGVAPSIFAYDDAIADTAASSEVTLTAAAIGTFSKEGRVSGRYINATTPAETGPTGTLIMQFKPPGNAPKMSIEKFPMVDGWFSVMVLDGAPMDYVLQGSEAPLFSGIQLSGGNLSLNGGTITPSQTLAKFSLPASYSPEGGSGDVRGRPPTETWVGYIVAPGLTVTTKRVCVPSDVQEGSNYFSDSSLTTRIDYNFAGSNASEIHRSGGGYTAPQSQIYTDTATPCQSLPEADRIPVYHTTIGTEGSGGAGIQPPFRALKPFVRWDNYIKASYNASGPSIDLEWSYLPGASSFDGVAILAKNSSNGGGGDMDDCDKLKADGYSEYASVGSGTTTYSFTGGGALNSGNKHNWRFGLCPYKLDGGVKKWIGKYVTGGQISDWYGTTHTGWAKASATYTGGEPEDYETLLAAPVNQVTNVTAASALYTVIDGFTSFTGIAAGDEVMLTLLGKGSSADCGTYNGVANGVGSYGFARVLFVSGSQLKIQSGTWVDSLAGKSTELGTAADPSNGFCHVKSQKVPHYRNLDLSSTLNFNMSSSAFDYGVNDGTIFALRVNGTLAMGATTVTATGKGFAGGPSTGNRGAGINGPSGAGTSTGSGGDGGANGAGGGGYGYGASAGVVTGGSGYTGSSSQSRLVFGGGGGFGSASNSGAAGGGIVMVAARLLHLTGNVVFVAKGNDGMASAGGGGGGGSVMVNAAKVTRSGSETLTLNADGGNGGSASAGQGGGGSAQTTVCTTSLTTGTEILFGVSAGATGTSSSSTAGYTQSSVNNGGWCSVY